MEPFASLAGAVRSSVPRVLINRDLVGPFAWQQRYNDIAQLGDVISGVEKLVELLDWNEEMQTLIQKEKEKVGRGSEPCLPPAASSFLVLELFWGEQVCACWGWTCTTDIVRLAVCIQRKEPQKSAKRLKAPHKPNPQYCLTVKVPQSRVVCC